MKIIELRAENLKRLKAVSIRPDGNLVEITGKNGVGKTSILDAIWWAIAGAGNVQAAPIRRGENEARIKLDLGEIKVTRTFKRRHDAEGREIEAGTTIIVESTEGARFPSPQKMLDALFGELSFDPLQFARSDPKAQFEALRRFVPGIDFDAIEKAHREDYQRRTDINRRAKEARAAAEKIAQPTDVPAERTDEAALVAELEKAGEHNAEIERRRARRQAAESDAAAAEKRALGLRERARALRLEADALDEEAIGCEADANVFRAKLAAADALPNPIDTATVRTKIAAARQANERFDQAARAVAERKRFSAEAADLEQKSAALTAAMDKRVADKRAAIAAAKMPVPGLEFGDGAVLLNGLPFEQASDAEQLRASIAIAMAANPKLRVIRVRDGSLLDEASMRLLAEMADAADCQVWTERVDSSGAVGFVIEDGTVVSTPAARAQSEAA